jgi:predicted RNA binding protein YcfA (HicA-like mRNA interferase family)
VATRDKRIAAMRRNPRNVRPDDLDAVLRGAGFTAHQEGSHKTYRRHGRKLTVPQHTPFLKPVYVKQALDMIEDALEESDGGD